MALSSLRSLSQITLPQEGSKNTNELKEDFDKMQQKMGELHLEYKKVEDELHNLTDQKQLIPEDNPWGLTTLAIKIDNLENLQQDLYKQISEYTSKLKLFEDQQGLKFDGLEQAFLLYKKEIAELLNQLLQKEGYIHFNDLAKANLNQIFKSDSYITLTDYLKALTDMVIRNPIRNQALQEARSDLDKAMDQLTVGVFDMELFQNLRDAYVDLSNQMMEEIQIVNTIMATWEKIYNLGVIVQPININDLYTDGIVELSDLKPNFEQIEENQLKTQELFLEKFPRNGISLTNLFKLIKMPDGKLFQQYYREYFLSDLVEATHLDENGKPNGDYFITRKGALRSSVVIYKSAIEKKLASGYSIRENLDEVFTKIFFEALSDEIRLKGRKIQSLNSNVEPYVEEEIISTISILDNELEIPDFSLLSSDTQINTVLDQIVTAQNKSETNKNVVDSEEKIQAILQIMKSSISDEGIFFSYLFQGRRSNKPILRIKTTRKNALFNHSMIENLANQLSDPGDMLLSGGQERVIRKITPQGFEKLLRNQELYEFYFDGLVEMFENIKVSKGTNIPVSEDEDVEDKKVSLVTNTPEVQIDLYKYRSLTKVITLIISTLFNLDEENINKVNIQFLNSVIVELINKGKIQLDKDYLIKEGEYLLSKDFVVNLMTAFRLYTRQIQKTRKVFTISDYIKLYIKIENENLQIAEPFEIVEISASLPEQLEQQTVINFALSAEILTNVLFQTQTTILTDLILNGIDDDKNNIFILDQDYSIDEQNNIKIFIDGINKILFLNLLKLYDNAKEYIVVNSNGLREVDRVKLEQAFDLNNKFDNYYFTYAIIALIEVNNSNRFKGNLRFALSEVETALLMLAEGKGNAIDIDQSENRLEDVIRSFSSILEEIKEVILEAREELVRILDNYFSPLDNLNQGVSQHTLNEYFNAIQEFIIKNNNGKRERLLLNQLIDLVYIEDKDQKYYEPSEFVSEMKSFLSLPIPMSVILNVGKYLADNQELSSPWAMNSQFTNILDQIAEYKIQIQGDGMVFEYSKMTIEEFLDQVINRFDIKWDFRSKLNQNIDIESFIEIASKLNLTQDIDFKIEKISGTYSLSDKIYHFIGIYFSENNLISEQLEEVIKEYVDQNYNTKDKLYDLLNESLFKTTKVIEVEEDNTETIRQQLNEKLNELSTYLNTNNQLVFKSFLTYIRSDGKLLVDRILEVFTLDNEDFLTMLFSEATQDNLIGYTKANASTQNLEVINQLIPEDLKNMDAINFTQGKSELLKIINIVFDIFELLNSLKYNNDNVKLLINEFNEDFIKIVKNYPLYHLIFRILVRRFEFFSQNILDVLKQFAYDLSEDTLQIRFGKELERFELIEKAGKIFYNLLNNSITQSEYNDLKVLLQDSSNEMREHIEEVLNKSQFISTPSKKNKLNNASDLTSATSNLAHITRYILELDNTKKPGNSEYNAFPVELRNLIETTHKLKVYPGSAVKYKANNADRLFVWREYDNSTGKFKLCFAFDDATHTSAEHTFVEVIPRKTL